MNAFERSDLADLRQELMHELRMLRDEIKELRTELLEVRRELDTLQGGLKLAKWLGPVGVAMLAVGFAKSAGLL